MKTQQQVAFTLLLLLIWVKEITCDQVSNTSGPTWTCTCSAASQISHSSGGANCSTSCGCEPDGTSGDRWTCTCATGKFPALAADSGQSGCFTACNCTSGNFTDARDSRKHTSSRTVFIILSLCLLLTTSGFIASIAYYFRQRDKSQSSALSSEKGSSWNSTTNLISYRSSVPESRIKKGCQANLIGGCIAKGSFLFKRKNGIIQGRVIQFSYSELEQATNNFSDSNLIGLGASSHVYRGQLRDGMIVAVKRLKTVEGPVANSVFSTEVELLSRLHHFHIVPLLGYCSISLGRQNEKLMVFEYSCNGNLRESLDGASGKYLDWSTRVAIALGAAKGLEYLHEAAAPRILHRDVKSTNILLDENWRPKITDLGMAKHLCTDDFISGSSSPARMQGTFGYFAPEYAIVGKASLKSDVFSFGVVLLELITGRTPIFSLPDKGEESLVIWAAPRLQNSRRVISELPDPHLKGRFPEEEMQIMAYLAKECLLLDPDSRPSMSEAVQVLSTIASDVSKRRFTVNLSQAHNIKVEAHQERPSNEVEVLVDTEELQQTTSNQWSPQESLFFDGSSVENDPKEAKLEWSLGELLLTSNARSRHVHDDMDRVDLTKPRLEVFHVGNGR